ncbi:MAG: ABC transporter ATP-binding protein, partial [Deltaproteobacteria bacterium]
LKILSRVTVQTTGRIRVKGRIASLLEVGTGFHPELTGRENVYLNGAILGMRKAEIRAKFDEIVDFSGCERYIDTPVKRYSSGMYVRLAFAVAAHLEPEILIVDEVLAVGDAEFQKKCLGKMKDVAGHGRTVLFVSHNMVAVQNLCSKGCLLVDGQLKHQGDILMTIKEYSALQKSKRENLPFGHADNQPVADGDGAVKLLGFEMRNELGNVIDAIACGADVTFEMKLRMAESLKGATVLISINDHFGTRLTQLNSTISGATVDLRQGVTIVACHAKTFPLSPGEYFIDVKILNAAECLLQAESVLNLTVQSGDFFGSGKMPDLQWGGIVQVHHTWSFT